MTTAVAVTPVRINARLRRDDLLRAVQQCMRAIPKKTHMPVLAHIKLVAEPSGLSFHATDLDVQVSTWISVTDVGLYAVGNGAVLVPAKDMLTTLKSISSDVVVLTTMPHKLQISANDGDSVLPTMPAEEFPSDVDGFADKDKQVNVDPVTLAIALDRTLPFASTDVTRYVLNGVYFNGCVTATDGHRLSQVHVIPASQRISNPHFILPAKGAGILLALCKDKQWDDDDVQFGLRTIPGGLRAIARRGRTTVIMRCIDGCFPDTSQVIPSGGTRTLDVNRKVMLAALKRIPTDKYSRTTIFTLAGDGVAISSRKDDTEVTAHVTGKVQGWQVIVDDEGEALPEPHPFTIGFNARYMLEAVDSFVSDVLRLEFTDELSPALIRPLLRSGDVDDSVLHVIMPMRK